MMANINKKVLIISKIANEELANFKIKPMIIIETIATIKLVSGPAKATSAIPSLRFL